jgi:hypothetical protein
MAAVITRAEYGIFAASAPHPAIPLNTPAWECVDYSPLYDTAPLVGANRAIPGVAGKLAVARERDEWQVSLRLVVLGSHDYEGNEYAEPREGLRTNLRFLRTSVFRPAITRTFTFYGIDEVAETGTVQVAPPFQPVFVGPAAARLVLNLVVPSGAFTVVP